MSRDSSDVDLAVQALNGSISVAVISHYNPDADALGSSMALTLCLRELGKKVEVFNESEGFERFSFLPGIESLRTDLIDSYTEAQLNSSFDLVVVLDCGDSKRVGDRSAQLLSSHSKLLNIDHHISNDAFGDLNVVDPKASSTCEILFPILEALSPKLSKDVATALLAGIYGDTGSFKNLSTSAKALRAGADLLDCGADRELIVQRMFESWQLGALQLRGYLIGKLELFESNKIAQVVVSTEDFERFGCDSQALDGFAEQLRAIDGVLVGIFIRYAESKWRISMRSKIPEIDLSVVAASFGGGGHKAAAAFRTDSSPEDFSPKLRDLIATQINQLSI